jgi:hypothetical protein
MVDSMKNGAARQNGRASASSSTEGTRSNTPAGKASQRSTPVPTNMNDKTGNCDHSTNVINKVQSSPVASQKPTNGVSRTEDLASNSLTEAHLAEFSTGSIQLSNTLSGDGRSSSFLSSPPASMIEDLEDYFGRPEPEPSPPTTEPILTAVLDGDLDSFHASKKPSSEPFPVSCPTTPAKEATPALSFNSNGSASKTPPKTSLEPSKILSSTNHAEAAAPLGPLNGIASLKPSPALAPTTPTQAGNPDSLVNGDASPSRSSRKRSISSADELALHDPPVAIKAESSRALVSTRQSTRKRTPARKTEDDYSATGVRPEDGKGANPGSVRRSKRAKTERPNQVEFDISDISVPHEVASPNDIADWEGWLEMESNPVSFTISERIRIY